MDFGNALWGKVSGLVSAKESGGVGFAETGTITLDNNLPKERPFKDLVGLRVVDHLDGRVFLSANPTKPTSEKEQVVFRCSVMEGHYTTNGGLFAKRVLAVQITDRLFFQWFAGRLYLKYFKTYDALVYAFETTTDAVGYGITLSKGWYVVNTTTFAHEAVDINDYRVMQYDDENLSLVNSGCWENADVINYTVKDENIAKSNDDDSYAFSYENLKAFNALGGDGFGVVREGAVHGVLVTSDRCQKSGDATDSIAITYDNIHPIDPKFLPNYTAPKKTVLYSGTPQKIDSGSMGILYVLSADNFLELAEGQNIYGELVVGGDTHSFVLDYYGEIAYFNFRIVSGEDFDIGEDLGTPTVAYIENLGGTGFGFLSGIGSDIGEISLTLWTELGGDKPYYISSLSLDDGTIPYINASNAKEAFQRDALYYRNNDDQVGKAVGFLPMADGFKALFFIPMSTQAYLVKVTAGSDGVTESVRGIAME